MNVIVNGQSTQCPQGQPLGEFLAQAGIDPDTVVVELSGQIVPRERFAETLLAEGNVLEVLNFVGGG